MNGLTELQRTRADWLDCETRNAELLRQVQALTTENFELRSKLITAQAMAGVFQSLASMRL